MDNSGWVQVEGGRVWYRMWGPDNTVPLLILHGGPGSSHLGFRPFAERISEERLVVVYDQLGCGQSDRPQQKHLWRIERFVDELKILRKELHLQELHILGHSWGTMLLAEYLKEQPEGILSCIFSGPCLSAARWLEDAEHYRSLLPPHIQEALREGERTGNYDTEEYRNATKFYEKRHVRQTDRTKEEAAEASAAFGLEVYETMWGPTEFYATGTLKGFDRTDILSTLSMPTLFTCGEWDEASPASTGTYAAMTPNSEFHIFSGCSHSPMNEDLLSYEKKMKEFLNRVERR